MSLKLIKQALQRKPPPRMWQQHRLKRSYDVVIIGGGVQGLACAYYLAKDHGVTNVAIIEKERIGQGGGGNRTAAVYNEGFTQKEVNFYDEGIKLYEKMPAELDFNVMFSQRGHLTLAHDDDALRMVRRRAEMNKLQGVEAELLMPVGIKRVCPPLDTSDQPRYPIMGGLHQPTGGVVRQDAVVWGYAQQVDKMGVHIHQQTKIAGIFTTNGKISGVDTSRGHIATNVVLDTRGEAANMAGIQLPTTAVSLPTCVTQPLKPFLDAVIVSDNLHIHVHQSDRGELVMGATINPLAFYAETNLLAGIENLAGRVLALFPFLHHVHVLHQWTERYVTTPDQRPIMGFTPVRGFMVDVGWGMAEVTAAPVAGRQVAELIAGNYTPDLLKPFQLSRFFKKLTKQDKT